MVTDNRSAGPWRPTNYEGYDPLPITALKVHILSDPESDKEDGLLRSISLMPYQYILNCVVTLYS